jgi:hypothetical protein
MRGYSFVSSDTFIDTVIKIWSYLLRLQGYNIFAETAVCCGPCLIQTSTWKCTSQNQGLHSMFLYALPAFNLETYVSKSRHGFHVVILHANLVYQTLSSWGWSSGPCSLVCTNSPTFIKQTLTLFCLQAWCSVMLTALQVNVVWMFHLWGCHPFPAACSISAKAVSTT